MIHIERGSEPPEELKINGNRWTRELLSAIEQYKGYDKIPKEIKNAMWLHYRHKNIKEALFQASYKKCAFCESKPEENGGNIEVEHFKPKSLYPEQAFAWENMLPVCRKCNNSKSDWDTESKPIINPAEDDPEMRLTYNFLIIKAINSTDIIATRTIEICNLNSEVLCSARAELLKYLTSYQKNLEETLKEIETAERERIRINKINKLQDSLNVMNRLLQSDAKYAGYTRFFLRQCEPYQKALAFIQEWNRDRGE